MEIETDKATLDVPSGVAGAISTLHVAEGQTITPGTVLFTVDAEVSATAAAPDPGPAPTVVADTAAASAPAPVADTTPSEPAASPPTTSAPPLPSVAAPQVSLSALPHKEGPVPAPEDVTPARRLRRPLRTQVRSRDRCRRA